MSYREASYTLKPPGAGILTPSQSGSTLPQVNILPPRNIYCAVKSSRNFLRPSSMQILSKKLCKNLCKICAKICAKRLCKKAVQKAVQKSCAKICAKIVRMMTVHFLAGRENAAKKRMTEDCANTPATNLVDTPCWNPQWKYWLGTRNHTELARIKVVAGREDLP